MNQEGETGLPPFAYIAVTQGGCQRGWSEKGAGGREDRGGGGAGNRVNKTGLERRRKPRQRGRDSH